MLRTGSPFSTDWLPRRIGVGIPGDLLVLGGGLFWRDLCTFPPPAWGEDAIGVCTGAPPAWGGDIIVVSAVGWSICSGGLAVDWRQGRRDSIFLVFKGIAAWIGRKQILSKGSVLDKDFAGWTQERVNSRALGVPVKGCLQCARREASVNKFISAPFHRRSIPKGGQDGCQQYLMIFRPELGLTVEG